MEYTSKKKLLKIRQVFLDAGVVEYDDLKTGDLNTIAEILIDKNSVERDTCERGYRTIISGMDYKVDCDTRNGWKDNINDIEIDNEYVDLELINKKIKYLEDNSN
jgi:hypothetical protein